MFNYRIHFCTTQLALKPLYGNNHTRSLDTMNIKEYCWYFIWLGFQVEVYKKA